MGIGTGLGVAGLASAGIGAAGAASAAGTQAGAAKNAAQLQAQEAQNALNFQEQEYSNTLGMQQPFLQAGQGAVSNLANLLGVLPQQGQGATTTQTGAPPGIQAVGTSTARPAGGGITNIPGTSTPAPSLAAGVPSISAPNTASLVNPSLGAPGSLLQPWTQQFQAPTADQAAQYPGYQFQLQQGLGALQNSAAARGGLLSGNTAEALQQYGQGLAQSDYTNVYNQALQQYQQNYNIYQQNQANQFNRLASLAGLGQTTAGQLGAAGASAAGNISNTSLAAGQQIGQNLNNAGAATASGYTGVANALGGGIGNLGTLASLSSLLNASNPNGSLGNYAQNVLNNGQYLV